MFRAQNELHVRDKWVVLFCDNLKLYIEKYFKYMFCDNKVILFWFPPDINNFIQPNDTVIGLSVHTAICHLLYIWLKEENMEIW